MKTKGKQFNIGSYGEFLYFEQKFAPKLEEEEKNQKINGIYIVKEEAVSLESVIGES